MCRYVTEAFVPHQHATSFRAVDGEGNPVPAMLVAAVSVEDHGRAPQVFELENDYSWTDDAGVTLRAHNRWFPAATGVARGLDASFVGPDQGYLLWKGPRSDIVSRGAPGGTARIRYVALTRRGALNATLTDPTPAQTLAHRKYLRALTQSGEAALDASLQFDADLFNRSALPSPGAPDYRNKLPATSSKVFSAQVVGPSVFSQGGTTDM